MLTSIINSYDLPLTPPMDLNFIGERKLSPFPMQLRTTNGTGLFGARRDGDVPNGIIRRHHGIDLLAPKGTKVFSSSQGKVISVSSDNLIVEHELGIKFYIKYAHIFNIVVAQNQIVLPGQPIAEVNENAAWAHETHLHFELRYLSNPPYADFLTINSTFAMYQWEIKTYGKEEGRVNEINNTYISSFEEIVKGRQLRFILIKLEGNPKELFLPIQTGLPEDESLAITLRQAFFSNKKVRIVWRDSLFFGKIANPQPGFNNSHKVAIIAEVRVLK